PDAAPVTTDGPLPETSDLVAGPARRCRERRADGLAADPRVVRRPRRPHRRSRAPGTPPGAPARGRGRPRPRRPPRAARGPPAGRREPARRRPVLGARPRWHPARGSRHDPGAAPPAAAPAYAEAARRATDLAERDHLVRQAARTRAKSLVDSQPRVIGA